jgi:NAD(P)-dependent dehydrogenase (short-subunit alcohol dehydrogenase family)
VAIADVDSDGLEKTAASLSGPALSGPGLSGSVLARVLDVRDAAGQLRFAQEVRSWLTAPLAAVFNNAGVAVGSSVLAAVPEDDQWLWDINFHGVVNGTRAFLPVLAAQDSGVVVNTSSVFGLMGIPYQSAYCASKFAVRGFTDSLRQELRGTGVRAVTVHPGGIKTNIARNARMDPSVTEMAGDPEKARRDFERLFITSPEKAARQILAAVQRDRRRALIGPDAKLIDFVSRLPATLYQRLLEKGGRRIRR